MTTSSYFTCTLGRAATTRAQQPYNTVNCFLDAAAKREQDIPVAGFAIPDGNPAWEYQIYTFGEIVRGSRSLACHLLEKHRNLLSTRSTVALLCPSTPEFLFTWLALIRLGHAVLLIAPQCPPAAIHSLCEQCEVKLLLHDDSYAEQAHDAASESGGELTPAALPFGRSISLADILTTLSESTPLPQFDEMPDDIAYLHHTSGTSTGVPKPIPLSHNAAVGVLPCVPDGKDSATFTTTPLYHGGVADLFRAWTSSALIWLFPSRSVPIIARNINKCLDSAAKAAKQRSDVAPVRYFSSVPYVLQSLEADELGMEHLRSMSMVGVGGAALPAEIGDRLVSRGVNLLSRFGSAECGFLLSSQRDFEVDREWQYLRQSPDSNLLRFEPREGGLCELVVQNGWPCMAKRNRKDGSFATSDLFVAHKTLNGAWQYHSRADAQLTLLTGKKFDPAPLEDAVATSDLVDDALVFGNGQLYPGMLLFRSQQSLKLDDATVRDRMWPSVQQLNSNSQDHARISKGMLIPMSLLEWPLEKSSKGTIIRGAAEKRFHQQIVGAYETSAGEGQDDTVDADLPQAIRAIVLDHTNKKTDLDYNTDLFSYGVDSVAGMQIRTRLSRLLPEEDRKLPMTVVEDHGTVGGLAEYIRKRRMGECEPDEAPDEHDLMRQLVAENSRFSRPSEHQTVDPANGHQDGDVIVLTGATGALGAHLLDQYRRMESVRTIYCLVRGSDDHAARERVAKALQQRKLAPLSSEAGRKVIVIRAQLGDSRLGLDEGSYDRLARCATKIMHVAWSVNFRLRLRSFVKDNIASVTNLINLALASPRSRPPVFAFCSSVASAMAYSDAIIPESIIDDPAASSPMGYSKSKWVAEQICSRANSSTALRGRVAVFRVGQLAGDSVHGVWNSSEAWPLMLSSVSETGSLPALDGETLDWLPVDAAATALIQGAEYTDKHHVEVEARVMHVVNNHTGPGWAILTGWLRGREDFRTVDPAAWVEQLARLEEEGSTHPALKLLSHWREAFATGEGAGVAGSQNDGTARPPASGKKIFATDRSEEWAPVLRRTAPVDEVYFGKLWKWIREEM